MGVDLGPVGGGKGETVSEYGKEEHRGGPWCLGSCRGSDAPQVNEKCKSRGLTLGREAAGDLQALALKVDWQTFRVASSPVMPGPPNSMASASAYLATPSVFSLNCSFPPDSQLWMSSWVHVCPPSLFCFSFSHWRERPRGASFVTKNMFASFGYAHRFWRICFHSTALQGRAELWEAPGTPQTWGSCEWLCLGSRRPHQRALSPLSWEKIWRGLSVSAHALPTVLLVSWWGIKQEGGF